MFKGKRARSVSSPPGSLWSPASQKAHLITLERYLVADWLVLLVLLLVLGIIAKFVPAYHRVINSPDPSLSFPLKEHTVPIWMLVVFSNILPLSIFISIWILRGGNASGEVDLLHSTLGLCQSTIFSTFVTHILKLLAGRPRPNFMDLCKPVDGICTSNHAEAIKSFPSGHSAFAFAGLVFLSCYILGKLRLSTAKLSNLDRSYYTVFMASGTWKLILGLLPLLLACWIAISRTRDYWHDFSDVIAGSLIGAICAILAYRVHYPSILSSNSSRPYAEALARAYRQVYESTPNDLV